MIAVVENEDLLSPGDGAAPFQDGPVGVGRRGRHLPDGEPEAILKQFSVEPRLTLTRIDIPSGAFTTKQVGARTDYGFSPRMFASALLQYSSADHTFRSNVRFRWEYRPGSELFVVWTDEHDTNSLDPHANLALRNRAFVVKMTRLFRF